MVTTANTSTKEQIKSSLQSILEASIAAGVPGLSAAISSSHGTLWESSAGHADLETSTPITTTHLFGIGSITKVFVAVVILQLLDEKRLHLTDTLSSLLDPTTIHAIPHAAPATLASLLSHTSGIPSWEDDPAWIRHGRGSALHPSKLWTKTEPLSYIRRPNPAGPTPGTWSYSNTNYTLLGLVIEKTTGNPAETEIRRRILDPLGMKSTYPEGFERPPQAANLPRRYHWATDEFRKTAGICAAFSLPRADLLDATGSNLSVEWTAGGMVSSPADLLRFALALRDGQLLRAASLDLMQAWRPAKGTAEMGHGIFRFGIPGAGGRAWLGHFGSVLGFTAALLWLEEGDCAVAVLANVGTVHAGAVPSSAAGVVAETGFLRLAAELAAAACG